MSHEDCIFCKIIEGKIPSTKVFENEDILAFRDINPVAPTHILIIPKQHFADTDTTPTDIGIFDKMYAAAKQIAIDEGLVEGGYRTLINCGANAGQIVFHIHMHIIGGKMLVGIG